jgi:poly(A) polymerase
VSETALFQHELPSEAEAAVEVVRTLRRAGHEALLAGGCVRDLLRGKTPKDYDVATDAVPERVSALFDKTRQVGASFGVVLVLSRRQWIEVATFRADGPYVDGRRPAVVHFTDARTDALRRDFTINGMFLDPIARVVRDYVGGRADLAAHLIRAIGDPAARFEEDHLRLLRAVRFAARMDFEIEHATFAAVRASAAKLANVAAERVREELERILADVHRARALRLLNAAGLLPFLWPGAAFDEASVEAAHALLAALPADSDAAAGLAALLCGDPPEEIDRICRALTCSNDQREDVLWIVAHQADLDDPAAASLAALKRRMAHRAFEGLLALSQARYKAAGGEDDPRLTALAERIAAIDPETVRPTPLISGDDLQARGIPPGPIYKEILDALYEMQLDERLGTREQTLAELECMLRRRGAAPHGP